MTKTTIEENISLKEYYKTSEDFFSDVLYLIQKKEDENLSKLISEGEDSEIVDNGKFYSYLDELIGNNYIEFFQKIYKKHRYCNIENTKMIDVIYGKFKKL